MENNDNKKMLSKCVGCLKEGNNIFWHDGNYKHCDSCASITKQLAANYTFSPWKISEGKRYDAPCAR